jgi:membrane-associated protease RseP (regulator of RpoE activity)
VATTPPEAGVPVKRGAVVVAVRDGSPAEIAGIRNGNVVVAIDGFIIQDAADLIGQISKTRPGQRIELGVYQAERLLRKSIVLADAEGLTMEVAETPELNVPGQAKSDDSTSGGLMGSFGGAIGNLFGGTKPPAARPSDPPALLPAPLTSTPPAPAPSATTPTQLPTAEVDQLKSEIQQLRQQLDALQRRLVELETTPER